MHESSSLVKRALPIIALALLALSFLSPALRTAYGFTDGQSASTVLGQPNFTTALYPTGALNLPSNFAFDSSGNLWIADAGNNRILEESNVAAGENPTILVALGQASLTTDAPMLTQNGLYNPSGLVTDPSGNLWVTDTSNNRVLEYTLPFSNGEAAAAVIGQANYTSSNLPAAQGGLNFPAAVTFDSSGNLWAVDSGNNRVLEFKAPLTGGIQASLAIGQPDLASNSALTTAAGLNFPTSARFDSSGNLWVADAGNNRILEYRAPFATGMNASLAIGQASFASGASSTTQAGLDSPGSLAFDSAGNLWVADTTNNRVMAFDAPLSEGMQASVVLGQGNFTTNASETTRVGMSGPTEVAFDKAGDLWVADSFNYRILEFAAPFHNGDAAHSEIGQNDYVSSLVDGRGQLRFPTSVALDSKGDLWSVDSGYNRVVEYASPLSTGMNASLAIGEASLTLGNAGGGRAGLSFPYAAIFDGSGNLWVSDSNNNRVLEFSQPFATGMNATLVIGQSSFSSYGNATSSNGVYFPAGMAFDPSGNLWVADAGNSRVLEFKQPFTTGMSASLVLGQATLTTSAPGVATNRLYSPLALAFDSVGDLLVADSGNSRVLGFAAPISNGESATIVIGQTNFGSRSPAISQTGLNVPEAIALDRSGNLWVSDTGNDRVLEFGNPLSTGESASLVVGQGTFLTDIPSISQTNLIGPQGLAFDSSGNLWVADASNNRLLEFSGSATVTASTITVSSTSSTTAVTVSTPSTSYTSSTSSTTTVVTTSTVPEFPGGPQGVLVVALLTAVLVSSLSRCRPPAGQAPN